MPNPRSTRKRARRLAGLAPHWRAFLTGEPVEGTNPFAWSSLCRPAPTAAALAEREAILERHAALIPEGREAVLGRYRLAWHGELRPGEVNDPARWW